MRLILTLSALLLINVSQAQTISVPIVVPPITVQVNQQATVNGITYNVTGTLTLTPVVVQPPPVSPPPAPSGITGIMDNTGAVITTAPAGSTVVVKGSGFGQFGTATAAGLTATPLTWTPTTVTLKLPTNGAIGSVTGPIILTPGDGSPQATSTPITITGLVAEAPPPDGASQHSPVIYTAQTLPDPEFPELVEPITETPYTGPLDEIPAEALAEYNQAWAAFVGSNWPLVFEFPTGLGDG